MSRKRKIQIAKIGLLLGILILVSTLTLSQAAVIEFPRTEREYLLIEQDYARVNAGEIFTVEYEVSLPLNLTLNLSTVQRDLPLTSWSTTPISISIEENFSVEMLDFLEGQYIIHYKDENCEVGIFLTHTHLRLKINCTQVGLLDWNLKMYEDSWVNKEIQGTVIFDRIVMTPVITSAWMSDYNATDCYDTDYYTFTFRWNPEEGRWEDVSPKEDP